MLKTGTQLCNNKNNLRVVERETAVECEVIDGDGGMSQSAGAPQPPPGPPSSFSSSNYSHSCSSLPGLEASAAGCSTVLMAVRVTASHSGIRPLCLPGCGDEALRLQLSMDPGKAGEFRLALRPSSGTNAVTKNPFIFSNSISVNT